MPFSGVLGRLNCRLGNMALAVFDAAADNFPLPLVLVVSEEPAPDLLAGAAWQALRGFKDASPWHTAGVVQAQSEEPPPEEGHVLLGRRNHLHYFLPVTYPRMAVSEEPRPEEGRVMQCPSGGHGFAPAIPLSVACPYRPGRPDSSEHRRERTDTCTVIR